jgi:hypothetical protein
MINLSLAGRLIAAIAGAVFTGLLVAPLADADADSAYSDLAAIYGDVSTFENSWGAFEDGVFFSDLTQLYNVISATGIDLGDPFASGATVSNDVSTVLTEGNTLTTQLENLEQAVATAPTIVATTDDEELPVIEETLAFQQQINTDIGELPAITAQDETNPLLIAYLSALDGNETNFDTYLINLGDELAIGSPAGITADNASILADGFGFVTDLQGAGETLTLLADLPNLGL